MCELYERIFFLPYKEVPLPSEQWNTLIKLWFMVVFTLFFQFTSRF